MSALLPRSRCTPSLSRLIPRRLPRLSLSSLFLQVTLFIFGGRRGETFLSNVSYYSDETPCCKL
jgi:hypothetical protein